MAVKPIPEGFRALTPYLMVNDLQASIDFMKAAFGAREAGVFHGPDGKPMHASLSFGDCMVMAGQAMPGHEAMKIMLFVYTADADKLFAQAQAAGGTQLQPVSDQPWGDRAGAIRDGEGNVWWIATHKEDLSDAQIAERMASHKQQQGEQG